MKNRKLADLTLDYYQQGRRLVAPLMGFPGVEIINSSIKLAQQNSGVHFKAIRQLVHQFSPDIIFPLMDLSVEANALGQYTIFPREDAAIVPAPQEIFRIEDLEQLRQINISMDSRVNAYAETVKLMSIGLPEQVIKGAYVTGPYTLASLMMGANEAAMATITRKDELHQLCELTTEKIQEYISLLISAGAELICFLEPSAVMLGPEQFERFSSFYVKHLNQSSRYSGVSTIYHTCGNTMHLIKKMIASGVQGISLDSKEVGVDLAEVAKIVPEEVVIMGNINPTSVILKCTADIIRERVLDLLKQMAPFSNFILSTGCDLPQETPLVNIEAFMDTGRKYQVKN